MAPGLSKVVVFEAGPNGLPNDVLEAMSTNTLIKQFSCSWDFGPVTSAQRTTMDNYFLKLGRPGTVLLRCFRRRRRGHQWRCHDGAG